MRLWRNWQTRTFEGRVGDRMGSSPISRTKKSGFLTRIYLFLKCSIILCFQGFSGFFVFRLNSFEDVKRRLRCTPVAHFFVRVLSSRASAHSSFKAFCAKIYAKGGERHEIYIKQPKRHIVLDDFEWRALVKGINEYRKQVIDEDGCVEVVNELLLKIINAPTKKIKVLEGQK